MFGSKSDEKKLFKSILENDLNTLRELAPKIKNKKILNKDNQTPFMIAMKNYNLDICELLSKESFPIEAIKGSASAICSALLDSDLRQLDIAVKCGADVNKPLQIQVETYPLALAINHGKVSFAKRLIDLGANTDIFCPVEDAGIADEFPLSHIAAQTCNFDLFDTLLDKSKDFYTKKGISIYWSLLSSKEKRETDRFKNKALKALFEKKVPFENKMQNEVIDKNAMSLLFTQKMESNEKIKREKLILEVLENNLVKFDFIDIHKNNLLKLSARMGSKKLVEYFIGKGLSPYVQDDQGYNAFHNAAALRDCDLSYSIMLILLGPKNYDLFSHNKDKQDANRSLDLANEDGHSPTHLAFNYNNYESARVLVEKGAKIPYSAWKRDEERVPLWIQLICHLETQEDIDNLIYFIESGLDIKAYKSKTYKFNLSISSVIGARMLLQDKFKSYKDYAWYGFYEKDKNKIFNKIDLKPLYKLVKNKDKTNSIINKLELGIEYIDGLLKEREEK